METRILKSPLLPLTLWAATILASQLHLLYHIPPLPPRIATHFDAAGNPNGWMTPTELTTFMLLFHLAIAALLLSIAFFIKKITWGWNIPHKQHWLTAPALPHAIRFHRTMLCWLGLAISLFLTALTHSTIIVNQTSDSPHLPTAHIIGTVLPFLIAITTWTYLYYRFFTLPTPPNPPNHSPPMRRN